MEYMCPVFMDINAVDALSIASSAYMWIAVYHKTLLPSLVCAIGEHAAPQTGAHYEIVILFHLFCFSSWITSIYDLSVENSVSPCPDGALHGFM